MLFRTLIPAAALMLAACSGQAADKPADAASGQSVIEVKEAFVVKPAEGRDIAAGGLMAYVTGAPVELVGASTDAAARVELHTMSMEDGVMQMRQVESFTASEGEPIVLQRGGNHLMLFGFDPSGGGWRQGRPGTGIPRFGWHFADRGDQRGSEGSRRLRRLIRLRTAPSRP